MGMTIRPLQRHDRDAVQAILMACDAFSAVEVDVALEVLDAGFAGEYWLFGAEVGGILRGYVVVTPTPMTESTWHLYWICVHPAAQGQGLGQALQARVESFIRQRGGERIVLETSGRPGYERQRRFYEAAGYREAGRIGDYYANGDDCVFYCKLL